MSKLPFKKLVRKTTLDSCCAKYDRTAQKSQCLNTGMVHVEKQGFSQFLTVRYTRKDIWRHLLQFVFFSMLGLWQLRKAILHSIGKKFALLSTLNLSSRWIRKKGTYLFWKKTSFYDESTLVFAASDGC